MTTSGRHRSVGSLPPVRTSRRRLWVASVTAFGVAIAASLTGYAIATADDEYTIGAPIAADEFDRAGAGTWGSAPLGGDYSLNLPASFSTDGVSGTASPPRSGSSVTATLSGTSALDVRASTVFSIGAIPDKGNGVYAGLQLRSAGETHYLGSARVAPSGAVWLSILRVVGSTKKQVALVRDVPALTGLAAGGQVHLEFDATGTDPVQLRLRAWTDGDEVPGWQAVVEDATDLRLQEPGALGVWSYVSSGSTAQPISYARLGATLLLPPTTGGPVDPSDEPTLEPPTPDGIEGVRGTPGALPIGSAEYAVPDGALVVDPAGSDSNSGTIEAPLASLATAIARAPAGATIVLRAGSYHGSYIIPTGKALTIQSYPGEAAWLDGSRAVENWQPDGTGWVAPGWDVTFDASPTYSRGAPDNTASGWQFVNPTYPMAAHPDQVWLNDVAQLQVGSRALLVPGTFYVDYAAQRLYLGSDPTGAQVRASDSVKALVIAGAGSVIRGIGIERYSPSVPDIGAVAVAAANVTIENVEITESATTGLALFASGTRLVDVTITRSGMLGAQASTADNLSATGMLVTDNNTEHFNRAPVSGGFKIHKSRGVSVTDSAFLGNRGNSLWFDESVYGITVTGNDIMDGIGNGIVIELSAEAVIANNIVLRSERDGILISDSGHVDVWNNSLSGNLRSVNITQGTRRASNLALPGHDSRQKLPDPTVTWVTEDISVSNNVFADGTGKCILCVEDYSHQRSADQMDIRSDGNVFQRTSTTQPVWAVVWSRGAGNPAVYTSVAAFSSATGHDLASVALDGTTAFTPTPQNPVTLAFEVESRVTSVALPLDAGLAALLRQPPDDRHLGAWY